MRATLWRLASCSVFSLAAFRNTCLMYRQTEINPDFYSISTNLLLSFLFLSLLPWDSCCKLKASIKTVYNVFHTLQMRALPPSYHTCVVAVSLAKLNFVEPMDRITTESHKGGYVMPLCWRQPWPDAWCFWRFFIHPTLVNVISQKCSKGISSNLAEMSFSNRGSTD